MRVAAHDAARLVLDERVVHRLERTLSVDDGVEVDVGVPERAARHRVTADADRRDGTDGVEELEEKSLRDLGVEVTDVERSSGEGVHILVVWFFFLRRGRERGKESVRRRNVRREILQAPL